MKKWINPEKSVWQDLIKRPEIQRQDLEKTVREIFNMVKSKGDSALFRLEEKFDRVTLNSLQVTDEEMAQAALTVSSELQEAIRQAASNIEKFHKNQMIYSFPVETSEEVVCWQETRPIERVGLYIPGGSAPLFSTVLMLAIPAVIAGCSEIVLCTPPSEDGTVHPAILFAAQTAGVKKIFKVGGVQAVAAMTFGTETIPEVDKLFGPGNQYVTAAKQYALNLGKAIDMPAGPSEVLVLADHTANSDFVAADLLSQAEHGTDSQVVLVTNDLGMLERVEQACKGQMKILDRREIAAKAMENALFIYFDDTEKMLEFSNLYAPEHLILSMDDPETLIERIHHAGSVFLGNFTPESAGDYASGTNHTLPTAGFARTYSGLNMDAFTKKITFQKITEKGLRSLSKTIETMAQAEGLTAHKHAVSIRLKNNK